jgi:TrmH family RNA methyltransferase
VRVVEPALLGRVGSLAGPVPVLALAPAPAPCDLAALRLDRSSLLLVVAGVADPGNLGALARAAEAFGVCALAVLRGGASPWNEKALRGSMGSLLRLPVATGVEAGELARVLAARSVRSLCAVTRGGRDPRGLRVHGPLALWVGGETGALPEATQGFDALSIPMHAGAESLNVTVAAAILLHELRRSLDVQG